jgi:hypothetical protein
MISVLQDCPKPLIEHCFKTYLWNSVPEPTLIIRENLRDYSRTALQDRCATGLLYRMLISRDNLRDYSRTALPYRIGVLQDFEIRCSFMIGVL